MNDVSSARWVRVGHSGDPNPRTAGTHATAGALGRPDPRLLLVFASFRYDPAELLAGVMEAAGDVPVIGCTTAGEIGPGPVLADGVVVVGFGGEFDVRTAYAVGLDEDPATVGEKLATQLLPVPTTRQSAAILLTDALAGEQQEMIRGVYGVVGATVPLIGGGAADDMRMGTSYQFYGGQVLQNATVGAILGSDGPIGIGVHHGWQRCSDAMVVTGSAGNEVHTLEDRPALDVYLDRFNAPAGIDGNPAAFFRYALTRPLAFSRRGDDAVRHVVAADPQRRTLSCAGSIPRGSTVWLMSGDVESTIASADSACAAAIAQLGDVPPRAVLIFDCAGRRAVLGDAGVLAEREVINERVGPALLAGFYTFGEVARTRGVHGFHNQTIVVLAVG